VKIRRALGGLQHDSHFYVHNPTGEWVGLSLRSGSGHELARVDGADPELDLRWRDQGGDTFYLVVARGRIGQENVFVGWRTALTMLHPHFVRCDDETGLDMAGADEITLTLAADGFAAGSRDWNEADTGESLGLSDPSQPGVTMEPAAFVTGAEVRVIEHDPDGDTSGATSIDPLAADPPTDEETVTFGVGTGEYSFLFHRSHWLPGD
jgi:hypothetical protein